MNPMFTWYVNNIGADIDQALASDDSDTVTAHYGSMCVEVVHMYPAWVGVVTIEDAYGELVMCSNDTRTDTIRQIDRIMDHIFAGFYDELRDKAYEQAVADLSYGFGRYAR